MTIEHFSFQEQTSHKLIEKRRRDRINNCLAELSQAVPAAFAKQVRTLYSYISIAFIIIYFSDVYKI
jgi:hypothetical protein